MATRRRRREIDLWKIILQLALLVAGIVICSALLWSKWGGNEEPLQTDPPDETTTAPTTIPEPTIPPDTSPSGIMAAYMEEHGLTEDDYTERQMTAYEFCPEARDFILSIPVEKDKVHIADISGEDRSNGVPLFLQWDERWGYHEYAYDVGGVTGCGPTCLSMVAYYLTGNTEYTPSYMMDFSTAQNCVGSSGGTNWTLFNRAAVALGFEVEELPLYKSIMVKRLEAGIPIVLNVGEGDFTQQGHYLVLTGYADGYFTLNDPNSVANSEKGWTYDQLEGQIKNLWAISLPSEES